MLLVEPAKGKAAATSLSSAQRPWEPGWAQAARQERVLGPEVLGELATLLTSLNTANKLQILVDITTLSRYHKEAL